MRQWEKIFPLYTPSAPNSSSSSCFFLTDKRAKPWNLKKKVLSENEERYIQEYPHTAVFIKRLKEILGSCDRAS